MTINAHSAAGLALGVLACHALLAGAPFASERGHAQSDDLHPSCHPTDEAQVLARGPLMISTHVSVARAQANFQAAEGRRQGAAPAVATPFSSAPAPIALVQWGVAEEHP